MAYIWTRRTCRNLVDIVALGTIYTQQALLKALKSQARQKHTSSVSASHTPGPDREGQKAALDSWGLVKEHSQGNTS